MMLALSQADGFAVTMIAILGTSFCFVAAILFVVIKSARKHRPEDDEFLDPADQEPSAAQPTGQKGQKGEPPKLWEKDADWWKK